MDDGVVPGRYVEYYLGNAPSLVWLLVVNATAFLVGVGFYVTTEAPFGYRMAEVPVLLYPVYGDSPTALAFATLSLATLLPNLGRPVAAAPQNRPLAYLHTLAFVWLVKYGLWTVVALNLRLDLYFGLSGPALWNYWGIVLTHLGFVLEAALIAHYGRTTRGALAFALVALLLNDLLDYGFDFFPPLRYDPGVVLAVATVALSVGSVLVASRAFDRL